MKQFIELLNETVGAAFEKAGFDRELGRVSVSNRPDLCEYQCNGAMSGAKLYHKKPIEIAEAVAAELSNSDVFEKVSAVMPGFLNLDISARYISDYVSKMLSDDKFGYENTGKQQTECCQASSCRTSPSRHHRREHQTYITLCRS